MSNALYFVLDTGRRIDALHLRRGRALLREAEPLIPDDGWQATIHFTRDGTEHAEDCIIFPGRWPGDDSTQEVHYDLAPF